MGRKAQDLTGQVFGNLTVITRLENNKYREAQWLCKCACGREIIATSYRLSSGKKKSCGCAVGIKGAVIKPQIERHTLKNRLYNTWANMHSRCERPKATCYADYGGRGIKVCPEWSDPGGFDRFREWAVSHGYADNLEIDRIDVNGNYEPLNCRFVTRSVNNYNKRVKNPNSVNGVWYRKDAGKWRASIGVNGKMKHLGSFKTKEEAIEARKRAELELGLREE